MNARAVVPSVQYRITFLAMLDDFDQNAPHNTKLYAPAKADFAAYVQKLLNEEQGKNLREGWVPCTHRWLVTPSEQVVGVTRLRHRIDNPFLSESAGHIGYDVAPSQRRKGYGHIALRFALEEATNLKIAKVLLYAAEDNLASRSIIERAGGKLERISYSDFWKQRICKYWITLADEN